MYWQGSGNDMHTHQLGAGCGVLQGQHGGGTGLKYLQESGAYNALGNTSRVHMQLQRPGGTACQECAFTTC